MSRVIRSYTETVGLLSRGDFARRLDEEMQKLLDAFETMTAESGKGTVDVKLEFKYELGRIDVAASFKTRLPETDRFMKTPFWIVEGALSVEHPSQADMFAGPRTIDASVASG